MELQAPLRNNLFFILVVLYSCSPEQTSTRYVNRDNSKIKTDEGVQFVNDSIFTGILFSLYANGKDTIEFTCYKNGREHGLAVQRYPNGQLQSRRYYKNGNKSGKLEAFWENGAKRLEYYFEDGEYEGCGNEWASNGVLVKKLNYRNGQQEGLQQLWTANGELWANYEVRNGRNYGITGVKSCATLWKNDSVSIH